MKAYNMIFKEKDRGMNIIGNEVRKHAENRRKLQQASFKQLPVHLFGGAFNRGDFNRG